MVYVFNMNITFTNIANLPLEFAPQPASKVIPEWYKNLESYVNNQKKPAGDGATAATIKRCMPVFDAITAGYILFTPADVYVIQKEEGVWFEWSNFDLIKFHPKDQARNHPFGIGHDAFPKFMNHWGIKTSKGYSVLITQPFHRESVFTIMPGVVDTDAYTPPINFPFTLNDPKFEGIIPAGTPLAQVIPFKREAWKMTFGDETNVKEQFEIATRLQTRFFDRYKNMFRTVKEYK
jgi:hypothetical protein